MSKEITYNPLLEETSQKAEKMPFCPPNSALIVDDNQLILSSLSRMLQKHISTVLTSDNFKDAEQIIKGELIPGSVVISDFNLHEFPRDEIEFDEDGLQLAAITHTVRSNHSIKFILMSGGVLGTPDEKRVHHAIERRVIDAFLPKPISTKEVLHRVGIKPKSQV